MQSWSSQDACQPIIAFNNALRPSSDRGICGAQRSILFDLKDEIVPPTNETVAQVFARLSAYRDAMDGPQVRN